MKHRMPFAGRRLWALCLQGFAVANVCAQSGPDWTSPSGALGFMRPPAVQAAGPVGARAMSQAVLRAPAPSPVSASRSVELGAELDLVRAVQAAVAWQPAIGAAVAQVAQQGSGVEVARAGYMPAFQAGVNAGRQSVSATGPSASLAASQMLYDFGKVGSQVNEAEAGVRRAQAEVLLQIDTVATQAALAVVELSRYQALEKIATEQVAALNDVARVTDLRAQLGASTKVDPVQARARVQAAQVYGLQLQSQSRQWRARLISLVAGALPERVAPLPAARLGAALATPATAQAWPAVLVAEAERQALLARLDGTRAARKPTVSLEASMSRYLSGQVNGRSGDHGLFVKLSSATFQGGAMAAQEQAAAQAVLGAEARVDAKRIEIEDKLKGLRERIDGLVALREPLLQRQRSITDTRGLYRDQYLSLGTRSALDLLNAEQEIAQAAFDVAQNQHDLWSALVNYIEASGQARDVYEINHSQVQGLEVLP